MNDLPDLATWKQPQPEFSAIQQPMQSPAAPTAFSDANMSMGEALDVLHRRMDKLATRLKPVCRQPVPQAPTCGQPMPPKPLDTNSPVVITIRGWERTVNELADKLLEIENSLDI